MVMIMMVMMKVMVVVTLAERHAPIRANGGSSGPGGTDLGHGHVAASRLVG